MKTTYASLLLVLAGFSYEASTSRAQQQDGFHPPEVTDAASMEVVPMDAIDCSDACDQRPAWARWWQDRMKPCLQYSHWGYADEFEEMPLGASLQTAMQAQICSGWSNRLVLYRYDFCDDAAVLNRAGEKRLNELAGAFPVWAHHVLLIEPTPGNPTLDNQRKRHVLQLLARSGISPRVEIGSPDAAGMDGNEARIVNELLTRQIRAGGQATLAAPMSAGGLTSGTTPQSPGN